MLLSHEAEMTSRPDELPMTFEIGPLGPIKVYSSLQSAEVEEPKSGIPNTCVARSTPPAAKRTL